MAKGVKTGGRSKGTPNRNKQEVLDILKSMRCDPIRGMARIAMNNDHPIELRGKMYAELAQYAYPKRKSLEHSGSVGLGELIQQARASMK